MNTYINSTNYFGRYTAQGLGSLSIVTNNYFQNGKRRIAAQSYVISNENADRVALDEYCISFEVAMYMSEPMSETKFNTLLERFDNDYYS